MSETKTCTRCKIEKPIKSFNLYKGRIGNMFRIAHCRSCASKLASEWRVKNLERYREYHREYDKKHPRKVYRNRQAYWENLRSDPDRMEKRRKAQREAYKRKIALNK